QRVTLDGLQPQERLAARCKETLRPTGVVPTVHSRHERASYQLAHLPGSLARVHPRVARHARVCTADLLAVSEVVGCIDAVDEDDTGLRVVVGCAHHALPEHARGQRAVDLAVEGEVPSLIVAHGADESIRDEHREVEVAQTRGIALASMKASM